MELNEKGELSFPPKESGFYFLVAETSEHVPQPADVDVRHYSVYVTFEVFPQ
jgi:hypothetical protein